MRKIFWDTMLFIYLLEGNEKYAKRCTHLLEQSWSRGDALYTSHLALGELLVGAKMHQGGDETQKVRSMLQEMGFRYLPFQDAEVETFASLRVTHKLKVADAIHLASAASAGMDLFLTGDKQLMKLHVPGINFIADFDTPLL